jgi:tetratricopeptide (TPR) repeat protein
MIPQNPSDWLLLDGFMTGVPYTHKHFNETEYGEVIRQTFADDPWLFSMEEKPQMPPWLENAHLPDVEEVNSNQWVCSRRADDFSFKSRQAFLATLALLKTAGNEAMHEGLPFTAARRYDLVIQYCAVALMRHEQSKYLLKHLAVKDPVVADKAHDDLGTGESKKTTPRWSPLIQLLVSTRLNLALLLLKPQFTDPARAVDQAKAALGYLKVFTKKSSSGENNPEILALQAKANFRMGSAKFELGNYSDAVEFFEASLKDSRELEKGKPDDALVLRRLSEAKKKLKSKKKRDRKKYERALHLETAKEARAREDD